MAIADEAGMKTVKYLEERLPALLGAATVKQLVAEVRVEVRDDLDQLLDKHRTRIRADMEQTIVKVRREAGELLNGETELLVRKVKIEAEKLVNASMDRATADASKLVTQLSAAIAENRQGAVTDIESAARAVRRELYPAIIWGAVIVGSMNILAILGIVFATR